MLQTIYTITYSFIDCNFTVMMSMTICFDSGSTEIPVNRGGVDYSFEKDCDGDSFQSAITTTFTRDKKQRRTQRKKFQHNAGCGSPHNCSH